MNNATMTKKTRIVSTFHGPSASLFSVKCRLSDEITEHLVVGKLSSLEVYSIQESGLEYQCSLQVRGNLTSLTSVPTTTEKCNILVMLDHPEPELLFLSFSGYELILEKQISLYERVLRPAEFLNSVLVDPSGAVALVSCYAGKLKAIILDDGLPQLLPDGTEVSGDISIAEINLLSFTFLHTDADPTCALLHIDHKGTIHLFARDIVLDSYDAPLSDLLLPTTISSKMVSAPADLVPKLFSIPPVDQQGSDSEKFRGGVLIVGGNQVPLFQLASLEEQEKQDRKAKRIQRDKTSGNAERARAAAEKEKARETKRRKATALVEWPWSEVMACTALDETSTRFLVGDAFGMLAMLAFHDSKLLLIPLGEVSSAMTLCYLTNNVVYLGSFLGDSQLLRITTAANSRLDYPTLPVPAGVATMPEPSSKGKQRVDMGSPPDEEDSGIIRRNGSFLEVLDTFKNIAPIRDAVLVDDQTGVQPHIVTCSGGNSTGSLNVIRSGADYEKLATIPGLANITNIWMIKTTSDDQTHSHVVASTLQSTYVFTVESAHLFSVPTSTVQGFVTNVPTLFAANIAKKERSKGYSPSSMAIQVTATAVYLLDYNHGLREYWHQTNWTPSKEIVAASVNASQVLLALKGGNLQTLVAENNGLAERFSRTGTAEISAVSCIPLDPAANWTHWFAVAYWGSSRISILSPDLQTEIASVELAAPARSLLFYNFGDKERERAYLFGGLLDGSVVSFVCEKGETNLDRSLKDMKTVSLGTLPVCLAACQANDQKAVFAGGSRGTLVAWDKSRITFSPVMVNDVTSACAFHTNSFSSSLIVSTTDSVFIGRVKGLNKLNIQSVPLGLETPTRIVHDPSLGVFGVACERFEPHRLGQVPVKRGSFRLVDDISFRNQLGQFDLEVNEQVGSLALLILPKGTSLFCIGTWIYKENEREPSEGRIVIFTAERMGQNLQLKFLVAREVKAAVYSLAVVNGMIAAAANSSVMLFQVKYSEEPEAVAEIKLVTQWNHNYLVSQLAVYNSRLVVCDAMHSVSLLDVVETGSQLKTVAKDFMPLWPVSVEAFDENSIIGANDALNLFSFTLDTKGNRALLRQDGFYHMGEMVSRILRGSVGGFNLSPDMPVRPTHLLFTSSGRISVVTDVEDPNLASNLTELERNLGVAVNAIGAVPAAAVGGISHARYRAPKNTRGRSDGDNPATGFLDGDLLEQTLLYSPSQVDRVFAGEPDLTKALNSAERVRTLKVLEMLQDMR
ncbi:CPSF A subunit region-domain-containing protein [Mycena floridula]|nr:CPSF A subunit region-domain-containing protein [Mycena floridula]